MVEETERVGDGRVRIGAVVPSGVAVRAGRRRRATRRPVVHGRHGRHPGGRRRAGQRQRPHRVGLSARPRGGAVDRRRAGRGRRPAAARSDPREQPPDARRSRPRRRAARSSTSASSPTTRRRSSRRCGAPPTSATRSSRAAACRWATTTSSRPCSAGSPTMTWMQIAIKPAKPFAFGLLRRHADLRAARQPGQLARQLRDARPAGAAPDDGPPASGAPEPRRDQRRRASAAAPTARCTSCGSAATFENDGRCHVRSVGAQGSHQLAATALSNAIAVVPDGDGVAAGRRGGRCR